MESIYTCPKCEHDLCCKIVYTDPPFEVYECFNCGWRSEIKQPIIRIPYKTTEMECLIESIPAACQKCPNHPLNGGSGFCNCTLGNLNSFMSIPFN